MKIVEVTLNTTTKQELFETLNKSNNTGFATNDLVKVVNAHTENNWEEASVEEMLAMMDKFA